MPMDDLLAQVNRTLEDEAPALARCLSPLGRRLVMPRGIPVQAQEARGTDYDGTIGLITDGAGKALPLPSMAAVLDLGEEDLSRAFLYSPVAGIPELREAWRAWQRRAIPEGRPSSLPLVTAGLCHSLSELADLFAGEGRAVAVPAPYWGNYRQIFAVRTGARLVSAPAYRGGRCNTAAIEGALEGASLAAGEPALALLNLPSNPGGYSLRREERAAVRESLLRIAAERPLVVVCDDAYAGLVYQEEVPRESMFWDLVGLHENLLPFKVDGGTKEFSFFGGRVGFLTLPFEAGSPVAEALESKLTCLLRATVGSPSASSQMILLQALRRPEVAEEVEAVRAVLAERYERLHAALAEADPALLRPKPFNSGCFALVELPESLGLDAERVRLHLLENHSTGLVSIAPRFLRIAHCSVAAEALPELVRRLQQSVAELSG